MPSTFTTGTINQPNSGAVGLAMADKIRDDVSAHAAWDVVEEFTPASGAARWTILKCLGSLNGLGSDFYVVMGLTLANGEIRMSICETYTAASHMMQAFATRAISTPMTMDASGRLPVSSQYILGATNFIGGSGQPSYSSWVPAGTSTKWWIIVAEDIFTVAFNGASNGFFHCGAYVPLDQLGNAFPIQMIASSDTDGIMTRNPAVANATLNTYGYALKFYGGGSTSLSYSTPLGFEGPWQYNDKLQNSQRAVAEVGMTMITYPGQSDWTTVYGFALGKQKRMRRSANTMPGGFSFGDAFALNGTLWVPWRPDLGYIFDTGVASS
jgi:hypothetical protein